MGKRLRRYGLGLWMALVAGCGGGSASGPDDGGGTPNPPPEQPPPEEPPPEPPPPEEPPPDPGPSSVVVLNGGVERPNPAQQFVTLHLRNDGRAGVYTVEVWGLPTSPNGSPEFMGASEPVEVGADYEETLRYEVSAATFADYVLVFTRDAGTAAYRQTDRFDFPE